MKENIIRRIKEDEDLSSRLFLRIVGEDIDVGIGDDLEPYITINGSRFTFSLEEVREAIASGDRSVVLRKI